MKSTVLAIVQQFCGEAGLPQPPGLKGATDANTKNLFAQIKRVLRELKMYKWPYANKRVSWVSVAGEDQGTILSLFGADYRSIVADTFWDETEQRPVVGPIADANWEALKTSGVTGPYYSFTMKEGHVFILPSLPAGHTMAVTYYSDYSVYDNLGVLKANVTEDDDTLIYDDDVVIPCLEWCWKKSKGEDWQDDRALWLSKVYQALGRDGGPVLQLDSPNNNARPGIIIPAGNWVLP